tara:strand:+ start:237 stop:761 length:525 start_codon:yes stop_codon:yes gene_type:complete
MRNIFLIGMMGSWKSTVGKKLAQKIKMEFIDTDDAIEELMEMKISEIFYEFGEKKFREMETAFFNEKSKQKGYIFSTGGGMVLDSLNRDCLQNNGVTFFLSATSETLAKRIHNTTKRPLLANEVDLQGRLEKIWQERKKYYMESSKFVIETDKLNPDDVMDMIVDELGRSIENN